MKKWINVREGSWVNVSAVSHVTLLETSDGAVLNVGIIGGDQLTLGFGSAEEARDIMKRIIGFRSAAAEDLRLLDDIDIGGNHLASSLVHTLGANFAEMFPPDANPALMRDTICNRVNGMIGTSAAWIVVYDIWVAWAAIMRARPPYHVSATAQTDRG